MEDPPIKLWSEVGARLEGLRLATMIDLDMPEADLQRLLRRLTEEQRDQIEAVLDEMLGDGGHET